MKTYEVLEKALALIERKEDWCQGKLVDGHSRCAIGALNFAVAGIHDRRELPPPGPARDRLQRIYEPALAALEHEANRLGAEARWNDSATAEFNNAHTHAEVVGLFQRAIQAEKAKAGVLLETPQTPELSRVYEVVS